jgi:hypothetical protein
VRTAGLGVIGFGPLVGPLGFVIRSADGIVRAGRERSDPAERAGSACAARTAADQVERVIGTWRLAPA